MGFGLLGNQSHIVFKVNTNYSGEPKPLLWVLMEGYCVK